jgi:hypothetical protein
MSDLNHNSSPDSEEPLANATWEEVEKEAAILGCLFKRLPDKMQSSAAIFLIERLVIAGSCCLSCALGMLEKAKFDMVEIDRLACAEESDEDD